MKVYIQGLFGQKYCRSKDLVKNDTGDVFRGEPTEYQGMFNLESQMEDNERERQMDEMFRDFIEPFSTKALTLNGIKELAQEKQIYLLPAVKKALAELPGYGS